MNIKKITLIAIAALGLATFSSACTTPVVVHQNDQAVYTTTDYEPYGYGYNYPYYDSYGYPYYYPFYYHGFCYPYRGYYWYGPHYRHDHYRGNYHRGFNFRHG